jgi:hypothetical protein
MNDRTTAIREKRAAKEALAALREAISDAIAQRKSYEVPAFCVHLRILDKDTEEHRAEAHRSKRGFAKQLLSSQSEPELIAIAEAVLEEVDHVELETLLNERTKHSAHRVSKLVRKDVLAVMNSVERLFGDRVVLDTLQDLFGQRAVFAEQLAALTGTRSSGPITQHYLRNSEWSHEEMLEHCGALDCPQTTFFRLIETVLHPFVRRDLEQSELALAISACLQRDGFAAAPTSTESGYRVYEVIRRGSGVGGAMKNLIFASIGPKPEIVIRDAVNNDVEIIAHADKVLVFDKVLSSSQMLSWTVLQDWWSESMNIADADEAKKTLYRRLAKSVEMTGSPGEVALFDTYYRHFRNVPRDKLPVLIPQVFLHYDPYTARQRGGESVLARQRMDFLMLLGNTIRVVLEVDGRHHYGSEAADGRYLASAKKYGVMAAEDRLLRLSGYEVYRFGGAELKQAASVPSSGELSEVAIDFFERLFQRHGLSINA